MRSTPISNAHFLELIGPGLEAEFQAHVPRPFCAGRARSPHARWGSLLKPNVYRLICFSEFEVSARVEFVKLGPSSFNWGSIFRHARAILLLPFSASSVVVWGQPLQQRVNPQCFPRAPHPLLHPPIPPPVPETGAGALKGLSGEGVKRETFHTRPRPIIMVTNLATLTQAWLKTSSHKLGRLRV